MVLLCLNVNYPVSSARTQPLLSVADVSGNAGETVEVEIELSNNPGIIALCFDVVYDSSKLKLISAEDKKILGTSTSTFGNNISANPYRLCWDDSSDRNNEENGVLVTLTFEILKDAKGKANVSLVINQKSTFNADFEDVEEEYFLKPILLKIEKFLAQFEKLQDGNLQRYIMYGIFFLTLALIGVIILG